MHSPTSERANPYGVHLVQTVATCTCCGKRTIVCYHTATGCDTCCSMHSFQRLGNGTPDPDNQPHLSHLLFRGRLPFACLPTQPRHWGLMRNQPRFPLPPPQPRTRQRKSRPREDSKRST